MGFSEGDATFTQANIGGDAKTDPNPTRLEAYC